MADPARALIKRIDRSYRENVVAQVLDTHRRTRNTRECTGCDWTPERPGGTGDPGAILRRNVEFNRHLAAATIDALGLT